ncbi:MAG: replication initiator protein [Arizlama microvirus]|nr:MAG: replication initiator protein [Arizlama microvirus]
MLCNHRLMIQDKTTGGILYVPCGTCDACKLNKSRAWSIRIMHEVQQTPEGSCFCTLTYDDEHLPKNCSLVVEDCQKFFKRLRKNTGKKIRYFLGAEYGEKGSRPHYHAILFGLTKADHKLIQLSWGLGYIHVGDVSHDSARYVAGYTMKKLHGDAAITYQLKGIKPEFALMSRGGKTGKGIGYGYVEKNSEWVKRNGFCIVKGNKVGLPRYYTQKVFVTDEERQQLHEKRQEVINQAYEKSKEKSGVSHGYEVADYQRTECAQAERDLDARQKLNRRKL